MSNVFLSDSASLIDLESRITVSDRQEYASFRAMRSIAAFHQRIFVLYKPTGLTKEGQHRPPEVLCQVRVMDFECDAWDGSTANIENMETGDTQVIDHIPSKVFNYPLFMCIAPIMKVRWDARDHDGIVKRSLRFAVLVKQRTKAENYSAGATMLATPVEFERLYPEQTLQLQYA